MLWDLVGGCVVVFAKIRFVAGWLLASGYAPRYHSTVCVLQTIDSLDSLDSFCQKNSLINHENLDQQNKKFFTVY